jgi:hypothetical protein
MDPSSSAPTGVEPGTPAAAPRPRHRVSIWLRELPYSAVLILTLVGVAYASLSRRPIPHYWEFLTPVLALLCIVTGWPHAPDRRTRVRLIWTQALHWLAFVVTMNLLLWSGAQTLLNSQATGLVILSLLALGTFVAGVHILAWPICLLGVLMALSVPAIAFIQRSAVFLALICAFVLAGLAAMFWWRRREPRSAIDAPAALP